MKLEYRKCGDYYLPNIAMPKESKETKEKHFGKYGLLRLNYLKNYKRNLYKELLLDNKLHEHLVKVDEEINSRVDNLIKELAEQEDVTEELKANNQLEFEKSKELVKEKRVDKRKLRDR